MDTAEPLTITPGEVAYPPKESAAQILPFDETAPTAPPLVFRVGVTGHRLGRLPTPETDELLKKAVRQVLADVKSVAHDVFTRSRSHSGLAGYAGTEPELRLLSPLAEGADRLVAEEALLQEYRLQCPLPFDREEYQKDFEPPSRKRFIQILNMRQTTAVLEMDGSRSEEKEAYKAAGLTVLRYCDVLIAIWDGGPGDTGGTAHIVNQALEQGIITIRIDSREPHEILLLDPAGPSEPYTADKLSKKLSPILGVPSEPELARFHFYLLERYPRRTFGFQLRPFDMLRLQSIRPEIRHKNFRHAARKEWGKIWENLSCFTGDTESRRLNRFLRADHLAELYADKYRNSLLASYIMGAFAVFAAFMGYHNEEHGWYIFELVLILSIIAITFQANRKRWHERWMDYRMLAEGFRQMRVLAPLARLNSSLQVSVDPAPLSSSLSASGESPTEQKKVTQQNWTNWYLRALSREESLPDCQITPAYLEACREILVDGIQSQVTYHSKNVTELQELHERLHDVTQRLFLLAGIACVLHLSPWISHLLAAWHHGLHTFYDTVLNLVVIVLPTFGAAIGAILHHREFEWTALRSYRSKVQLQQLADRIPAPDAPQSSKKLGEIAEQFSKELLTELNDWGFVFRRKKIGFPS